MDLADYRVLLEMHRHPFASLEAIGRAAGRTGTSVKSRLAALEARGTLQGYFVLLPAAAFGRHHHIHSYFDADPEPELGRILEVEDVVSVWRGAPGMVNVNTYDPAPTSRPPTGLVRLFGRPPDGHVQPENPNRWPPSEAVLSPLDWRVVGALLDAPRGSLRELADATGLTAKTVRKRRDRLLEKGLLQIAPILDTSQEQGLIVYSGYVSVAKREVLPRVQIPNLAYVWTHYMPPAAAIMGHAESYGEVIAAEKRLRSIPGVTAAILTVARGGGEATARLQRWVHAELRRWDDRTHRTAR